MEPLRSNQQIYIYQMISSRAKSAGLQPQNMIKLIIQWRKINAVGALEIRNICKNLLQLHLNGTYIGNKGCKILSQAKWKELVILQLYQNEIDNTGILHLSKNGFTKLDKLHLGVNKIRSEGIKRISKANWIDLKQLYSYQNQLNYEAGYFFCYCQWPGLQNVHVQKNWTKSEQRRIKSFFYKKFDKVTKFYT